MSLVTRCPECKTLFRVQPQQLQARGGKVRCGQCRHVFDGFGALSAQSDGANFDSGANVVSSGGPQQQAAANNAGAAANNPGAAGNKAGAANNAGAANQAGAMPSGGATIPPPDAKATAPQETVRPLGDDAPALGALSEGTDAPRLWLRRPTGRNAQLAGCLALVLLLLFQTAFAYRGGLAARYPVVRSVMTGVCGVFGCSVPLPARPDLVKIEASDVHMIDTARPGLIQLTATLRSYANHDLAYPALDLVLTNANEHALARRIFVPEDYLDGTRDPQSGISPRAEITVALDLDTGDLNAAGFRLDLVPAPASR